MTWHPRDEQERQDYVALVRMQTEERRVASERLRLAVAEMQERLTRRERER